MHSVSRNSNGSAGSGPRGRRILVVEDYFALAESLSLLLEQEGWQVVGPVPTVEAALRLIESEPVDGAILDVDVRGVSVGPVAERLLEDGRPFIFLTGYSDGGDLTERFRDQRWISKPAEERELLEALRAMDFG